MRRETAVTTFSLLYFEVFFFLNSIAPQTNNFIPYLPRTNCLPGDESASADFAQAGADGCLLKPVGRDALLAALTAHLTKKKNKK